MTYRLSRRWLLAALFFVFGTPLSALAQFDLALSGGDSPDPAVAGSGAGNLTHTFTLSRSGASDATGVEVNVTQTLPAGVTIDSVVPSTGSWVGTTWTVGDWPASANGIDETLTITLTVDSSASVCTQCISIEATVSATNGPDADPANDTWVEATDIARQTSFALTVACEPDAVIAGSGAGNISCTISVAQNGPSDASGVSVGMTLPAGVTVDSADLTNAPGTSFTSPTWTLGDAPNGYTADITLTMTADATATGDLTIVAAVTANETITNGPVSADDSVGAEAATAAPTRFLTTIGFTNGYPGEVTVMISCNSGTPLEQDFEISVSTPVNFVVDLLDFVAPDVDCAITLEAVGDGYVGSFLANGVDTGDACLFSSEPEVGEAPFNLTAERENTCAITAEPVSSTFEVEKLWEFEGDGVIALYANINIWCAPASTTTGPDFGTVQTFVSAYGDATFNFDFYPDWDGGATCYAEEYNLDSAVESDGGCAAGTDFVIGEDEKGCTITNTVFFEGIPTLSRYGLAVMALLMLGLGFVGFRRFV